MKRSKLYRRLGATRSVFLFEFADMTLEDDGIESLSMKRGTPGAQAGITACTASAVIPYEWPPAAFDTPFRISLSPYGMELLRVPESCRYRWTGRIAAQEVDDRHDTERHTTISASSWAMQVPLATKDQTLAHKEIIKEMLLRAWNQAKVPSTLTISPGGDTAYAPAGKLTVPTNEVWGKWCKDLGLLLRTHRDGSADLVGLYTRETRAAAWRTITPTPLTRRQCLSPAGWAQPVTNPGSVKWTYRVGSGETIESTVITVGYGTVKRPLDPVELDTSHAIRNTSDQERLANALANAETALGYRVEGIRIDLVELATSDIPADHELLVQLLELEEGDPVTLSYDWPQSLAAVYYASVVEESVTPDGWVLTLTLDPTKHITGKESPDPAGTTWDTRFPDGTTWDSRTTTWDNP